MSARTNDLLTTLLRDVSRSFYLTLRVLPRRIRPQIALAYLLARATDTIADTALVPLEQRRAALHVLRDRILGISNAPLAFGELVQHQALPAEKSLLERLDEALAVLERFEPEDRQRIREVLAVITSGQELDLVRFAGASAAQIVALPTDSELEDYTWRVAGCVGEFWTRICRAHVFPSAKIDDAFLLAKGIDFGKGLQLVNILRDLPADLRQGRCYLPSGALETAGLTPADLLEPKNEPRLRPLYDDYLGRARDWLTAGWEYTNALPFSCPRLRLACAWPVLIGGRTIGELRRRAVLDPADRIRVSRREVRALLIRSLLVYPFPSSWRRLYRPEPF